MPVSKNNAAAAEALAEQEALKKRAAKQAAATQGEAEVIPIVTCRVLPMGHEKISMGIHVPGTGEAHYDKGETFPHPLDLAQALERRGYVEIIEPA